MSKPNAAPTVYYDLEAVHRNVSAGRHRQLIGGLWDEMGRMQFEYLRDQGLQPNHRLLDIGCGCFRGGVHFVDYLDSGNYYGIDVSEELIEVGYQKEIIPAGLATKLPRENLIANADFDVSSLDAHFDFALAQSLFTHLPLNLFSSCLAEIGNWMKPSATLFATFFEAPHPSGDIADWVQEPGGFITHAHKDPFHSSSTEIVDAANAAAGWKGSWIGEWGHPRAQKMMKATRQ